MLTCVPLQTLQWLAGILGVLVRRIDSVMAVCALSLIGSHVLKLTSNISSC